MLDKQKHQLVQKQLLREIFSDSELSAQLVFKGGTALMMFYDLNRFSTLSAHDYYRDLLELLGTPAVAKNIMLGLGEVLDNKEREWARLNLVESLRQQLLLRL